MIRVHKNKEKNYINKNKLSLVYIQQQECAFE